MDSSVFAPLHAPLRRHNDRRTLGGGWRQRALADERDRSRPNRARCRTALMHLSDWGTGVSSAVQVWRHVDALLEDGFDDPSLRRMHGAGAHANDQHIHTGLMRLVGQTCGFEQYLIEIAEGSVTTTVAPSDVFSLVHKHNRHKFTFIFGAEKDRLRKFWTGLFASDEGAELRNLHPMLQGRSVEQLCSAIPVVVHEDAAPYTKRSSCSVVTWGSILCKGTDIQVKFLHHTEARATGLPANSCRLAWKSFFDQMDALAEGIHLASGAYAAQDPDGTVWRCILLFGKCDLEQLVRWGHRSYNDDMICSSCNCDRSGLPWTDLRANAPWRATEVVSDEEYRLRITPGHPIAASMYFNKYFFRYDVMHLMDLNGSKLIQVCHKSSTTSQSIPALPSTPSPTTPPKDATSPPSLSSRPSNHHLSPRPPHSEIEGGNHNRQCLKLRIDTV